ncbi:fibroblast growth factor-binding protein 3 isoform X1 [Bubalus bubalis]|uniref:fibroblast growth factor-binding protein 3 isoform X1 n=1 Tax=Bubalus bubalis TaxID=89462 RepID=UPI001D113C4B|nr:fibroblast growth factor-binding protein 3 isoform X1 [Bubalus bubalis]
MVRCGIRRRWFPSQEPRAPEGAGPAPSSAPPLGVSRLRPPAARLRRGAGRAVRGCQAPWRASPALLEPLPAAGPQNRLQTALPRWSPRVAASRRTKGCCSPGPATAEAPRGPWRADLSAETASHESSEAASVALTSAAAGRLPPRGRREKAGGGRRRGRVGFGLRRRLLRPLCQPRAAHVQLAAPAARPRARSRQRASAALPRPGRGAPPMRLPRRARALRCLRRPPLALLEAGAERAAQEAAALPRPGAAQGPPVRRQEGPWRGAAPGTPGTPGRQPQGGGGLNPGPQAPGREPGAAPRARARPRGRGPASPERAAQREAL